MGSMLTKGNINKLLKGRQLYDDCREAKASAHAAESQDGKLQEKLTAAILNRDAGLSKLGITNLDELLKFNKEMCLELLKTYRTVTIGCDFCKNYDDVPPCSHIFGNDACGITKKLPTEVGDYTFILEVYQKGNPISSTDDGTFEIIYGGIGHTFIVKDKTFSICPNRQNKYKCKIPDSAFPFPPGWRLNVGTDT